MAHIELSMTKQLFFMFFPCCRKSKPCVSWQAFAYHRRGPGRALFAFAAQHSSGARMLHRAPGTTRYVPDVRSDTRRSEALEMLRRGRLARSVTTGFC